MKKAWMLLGFAALLLASCSQAPELGPQQILVPVPLETIGTNSASDAVTYSGGVYTVGVEFSRIAFPNSNNGYLRNYKDDGTLLWSRSIASGGGKADSASGVALDNSGNIYVAGWTEGTLTGSFSRGGRDGFIRKYDPQGNVLWTVQLGTTETESIDEIIVDKAGNIYVAGRTFGTFPGGGRLIGQTMPQEFLAKYTPSGYMVWVRQNGDRNPDYILEVTGLAATLNGRIIVIGEHEVQYDNEPQWNYTTSFITQYGSDQGDFRRGKYHKNSRFYGIAVDANNNVYLAGACYGRCFPSGGTGAEDPSPYRPFVAKMEYTNENGFESFEPQWTYTNFPETKGLFRFTDLDLRGQALFVSGFTNGTVGSAFQNKGGSDAFAMRLSFTDSGYLMNYVPLQVGSSQYDIATAVTGVSLGESYMVGYTDGVLPGQTDKSGRDAFLWRGYQQGWGFGSWLKQY